MWYLDEVAEFIRNQMIPVLENRRKYIGRRKVPQTRPAGGKCPFKKRPSLQWETEFFPTWVIKFVSRTGKPLKKTVNLSCVSPMSRCAEGVYAVCANGMLTNKACTHITFSWKYLKMGVNIVARAKYYVASGKMQKILGMKFPIKMQMINSQFPIYAPNFFSFKVNPNIISHLLFSTWC